MTCRGEPCWKQAAAADGFARGAQCCAGVDTGVWWWMSNYEAQEPGVAGQRRVGVLTRTEGWQVVYGRWCEPVRRTDLSATCAGS